jgi:hypothetical protein
MRPGTNEHNIFIYIDGYDNNDNLSSSIRINSGPKIYSCLLTCESSA